MVAFGQDSVYRRQGHRNIEPAAVEYNQRCKVQGARYGLRTVNIGQEEE